MSLNIQGITKFYGTQKALNAISFEVKKGEILGFLGPNGAGKSTMMKIISTFITPNDGKVLINGIDNQKEPIACCAKIGYLPEHNPLYLELYVKEFLHFCADLHQIKHKKERVAEVIQLVGLKQEQHKKISALSKGYRQRVGLAHAIIHDPEVLILDEPTTGLDPNQIVEIRNLIADLGKNKTVMLSTHIMQEVEALCHRVVIIHQGNILANESISDLKTRASGLLRFKVEFERAVTKEDFNTFSLPIELSFTNAHHIVIEAQQDIRAELSKWALQQNNVILSLQKEDLSLEKVFQQLTQLK